MHPLVMIGEKGVTPGTIKELNIALESHELVKIRLSAPDRDSKSLWLGELIGASRSELVQQIGHIATVYRKHPKEVKIPLPK